MELFSETNKQIFLVISEENLIMIKTIKISLCTFFQMMKWAWVQYSAILIVFIIFFREVKQFVFSKQVLPSIVSISK